MTTAHVAWAMYRDDIWWFGSMLVFVAIGFWGGYELGKEHCYRRKRDAKGRYVPSKR